MQFSLGSCQVGSCQVLNAPSIAVITFIRFGIAAFGLKYLTQIVSL